MEEHTDTFNGPVTPFKAARNVQGKDSSAPLKPSTNPQAEPVLFASPIFTSKTACSAQKEPGCAIDAPGAQVEVAEDAASLSQIQFATPSPFPVRTKRARSTASTASGAQLASSYQQQDQHGASASEAQRPEGFSPIACFPSLEPERALNNQDTAAPRAQRDLFANGACSRAVQSPLPTASPAPAALTCKPKRVATFGELVAEGIRRQQLPEQLPALAAVSSDDEGSEEEPEEIQEEAPTRLMLSAKDEQWLKKMVAHYTSKTS